MLKIKQAVRRPLISRLHKEVNSLYHSGIPTDQIDAILRTRGFMLCCEDGTPFSAFFCGESSCTLLHFADVATGEMVVNCYLSLSWHQMPSGRYEIVAYLT
jgi:hypothetical protein